MRCVLFLLDDLPKQHRDQRSHDACPDVEGLRLQHFQHLECRRKKPKYIPVHSQRCRHACIVFFVTLCWDRSIANSQALGSGQLCHFIVSKSTPSVEIGDLLFYSLSFSLSDRFHPVESNPHVPTDSRADGRWVLGHSQSFDIFSRITVTLADRRYLFEQAAVRRRPISEGRSTHYQKGGRGIYFLSKQTSIMIAF